MGQGQLLNMLRGMVHQVLVVYGGIILRGHWVNLQLQNFLDYIPVGLRVIIRLMLGIIMKSGPGLKNFMNYL